MDIFPIGSTWHDPRHPAVFYRIDSTDLLSADLQIVGSPGEKITRLLIDLIDLKQIPEDDNSEWYEAECNLFI
jgi:hypothetical protein